MGRHEIGIPGIGSVVIGDEIKVSFNPKGFRYDCNRFSIAAVMGATMTLGFCGFPALMLYTWFADPAERSVALAMIGAVLWVVLLLVISTATWPAMQTAKLLKKTLRKRLPALIISRDGITDHSSNSVFGLIPWSQIQTVFCTVRHSNIQNQDYSGLVIVVRDKSALRRRLGLAGYRLEDYPRSPDRREVFIPQNRIAVPVEDAARQINAFRARMGV